MKQPFTQEEADQVVADGVKYLNNTINAKWWKEVDLDKLDLGECNNCVMGQLLGVKDNDQFHRLFAMLPIGQSTHGFCLPHAVTNNAKNWAILGNAWRRAILELRKPKRRSHAG